MLILTMEDTFGDGWSTAGLTLIDDATGSELEYATLKSGYQDTLPTCVPADQCFRVEVSDDSFPSEVSWVIDDADGNELAAGGAGETVSFCVGTGDAGELKPPVHQLVL